MICIRLREAIMPDMMFQRVSRLGLNQARHSSRRGGTTPRAALNSEAMELTAESATAAVVELRPSRMT